MQSFQACIVYVLYANQLAVKNAEGVINVIVAGVKQPDDPQINLSAKEFLRAKVIDKTCTVTPFKKLDDGKVIGRVTIANASIAVQLAKNGYCQAYGAGEEAEIVKAAYQEDSKPLIYKFVDMTKKSQELERFAAKKEYFTGYIDFVRDSDTFVLIAKQPDNTLLKFIGSLHGVFSKDDCKATLYKYVQKTCRIQVVCNTVSNIVECQLSYDQKDGTALNLNDILVGQGVVKASGDEKKEKGAYNGGFVIAVNSGDSLNVMLPSGEEKVYLASVMAPKFFIFGYNPIVEPYGYEAKNWLRERLYGKKVTYQVDYMREMEDGTQRQYCSVFENGYNVAEEYIRTGLAKIVRHGLKDTNRSAFYEQLVQAQQLAEAEKVGQFSGVEGIKYRISDFSSLKPDEIKARASRFMSQHKQTVATVEQVITPSKFKLLLYIDAQTLAFIIVQLAGVWTPSLKKEESGSLEALEFSRKYQYRQVKVTFTGDVEKHTSAMFVFCYLNEFFVNQEVISAGWGRYQVMGNYPEFERLKQAENRARAAKRGIYGTQILMGSISDKEKVRIIAVTPQCQFVVRQVSLVLPVLDKKTPIQASELQKNRFCGIEHEGKLYRCRITQTQPLQAFLIDQGETVAAEKERLFRLREQDFEEPQQVVTLDNACIEIMCKEEAVAEAKNLIGQTLTCCPVESGVFVLAEGTDQLSIIDSFGGYLLEKGLARVDQEYNGVHCQELFELEQNAVAGQRGFWKG